MKLNITALYHPHLFPTCYTSQTSTPAILPLIHYIYTGLHSYFLKNFTQLQAQGLSIYLMLLMTEEFFFPQASTLLTHSLRSIIFLSEYLLSLFLTTQFKPECPFNSFLTSFPRL